MNARTGRWTVRLGAPLLGLLWFCAHRGLGRLPPGNLGWLMEGDWAQEMLGWFFFRHEPFRFPLGTIHGLAVPLGTTVGFADANPWMCTLLRPFSTLMPLDFQFNGAWLLLCHAMQAVMGAKILQALGARRRGQLLGAALFLTAPILQSRLGHLNMCAHFLLLGAMLLHLSPRLEGRAAWRRLGVGLGLVAWACGTHPYVGVMVTAVTLAFAVRLLVVDRAFPKLGRAASAVVPLAPLGVALAVLVLFGYVGGGIPPQGAGFGDISADLLTLVNPTRSRLFPSLSLPRPKDEGYGYLGLGVLLLGGLALGLWVRRRGRRAGFALVPLYGVVALCAVFSLADSWTFAGHEVLGLQRVYDPIRPLVEPFRASGRFIWPLHYLLVISAAGIVVRAFAVRPAWAEGALALAVALQLADLNYEFSFEAPRTYDFRLTDSAWDLTRGHYAHLELAPPILHDGAGHGCGQLFPEELYERFGYLAYRLGLTSNSMYLARVEGPKALAACAAQDEVFSRGAPDPQTVYVVHPQWRARVLKPGSAFACGPVERMAVCVAAGNRDAFALELARRMGRAIR